MQTGRAGDGPLVPLKEAYVHSPTLNAAVGSFRRHGTFAPDMPTTTGIGYCPHTADGGAAKGAGGCVDRGIPGADRLRLTQQA